MTSLKIKFNGTVHWPNNIKYAGDYVLNQIKEAYPEYSLNNKWYKFRRKGRKVLYVIKEQKGLFGRKLVEITDYANAVEEPIIRVFDKKLEELVNKAIKVIGSDYQDKKRSKVYA